MNPLNTHTYTMLNNVSEGIGHQITFINVGVHTNDFVFWARVCCVGKIEECVERG